MDDGSLSNLLIILALILLRGLLALAYGALSNARQNIMRQRAEDGHKAAAQVLSLTERDTHLMVTYQITALLLHVAIAAVVILEVAIPLTMTFTMVDSTIIYTVVLLIAGCLTLILGELVPESIGSAYANTLALWFVAPVLLLISILRPLTTLLIALSKALSTLFNSDTLVNTVTEEEIVTLVESGQAGGSIEEEEKEMIISVLQLDETHASEVMVPRIDITALDMETSLEEARKTFIQSGYSRIPIYEDTIDNIRGLLYAKDLLSYSFFGTAEANLQPLKAKTIRDLMRPAYFIPETKPADDLLKELQSKRVHMAIVVDEFGGTAGIVTIEDLIEEIIGEIRDEHDPQEEEDYIQLSDNEYMVDASISIHDFDDLLDIELPDEESDTLGGFIYTQFGHVPLVNEEIYLEELGLKIRVEQVDGRRIRKVKVTLDTKAEDPKPEPKPDEKADKPDKTDTSLNPVVAVHPTSDLSSHTDLPISELSTHTEHPEYPENQDKTVANA